MYFLILFLFLSCAASNNISSVIVHMPGVADGGFNFLNPSIFPAKFDFNARNNQELNPKKIFNRCDFISNCMIYTNNIPLNLADLGGKQCISFYKNMILDAHKSYPKADIILIGASQGSVGPFGALAELIQENNSVIANIKKVMIEAVLGSIHETFNFHALKIPIIKILPHCSVKNIPLLMEYFFSFLCKYDAFSPQMYHYIEQINKSDTINHINFLMLHDTNDEIIPVSCAQKATQLFKKNNQYIETTVKAEIYASDYEYEFDKNTFKKFKKAFIHLPSNASENYKLIDNFLNTSNTIEKSSKQKNPPVIDNFFVSKTPLQRFVIRRIRDVLTLTSIYIFFKSVSYVFKKFIWHLKNRS